MKTREDRQTGRDLLKIKDFGRRAGVGLGTVKAGTEPRKSRYFTRTNNG